MKPTEVRNFFYQFYEKNRKKGKTFTVNHFLNKGVARSTIYRLISRYGKGKGAIRRVKKSVRPKMPLKKVKRLKAYFDHKTGVFERKAARKFGISVGYVNKLLKTDQLGCIVKCRKKIKIPDRSEVQKLMAKRKCRNLTEKFAKHDWVIDDESYFGLSHGSLVGNDNFYTSDFDKTPNSVKYQTKSKYEKKLMVWVAASINGLSEIYVVPSRGLINSDIYIEECLKKRLIPFIKKKHYSMPYVFWPDLASAHYASNTIDCLNDHNVKFVAKNENPANLPECRPIERFWYLLKAEVYKDDWCAPNLKQLERKIRDCVKNVNLDLLVTLFGGVRSKIRDVGRNGTVETR